MSNSNEIWELLTCHGKLDRDRGIEKLRQICDSFTSVPENGNNLKELCDSHNKAEYDEILSDIFQKIMQFQIPHKETTWETKIGILQGCQVDSRKNRGYLHR